MSEANDLCLRCQCEMEPGFIYGVGHRAYGASVWVQGEPKGAKLGIFGIQFSDQPKYETMAKRCTACGWLDFYATKRVY